MELPRVLLRGKFLPADLEVSVSDSNRKIDPKIESQLEAIWIAKKKQADEAGKVCYNGLTYRLNSMQQHDGKIVLDFGTLEFKVREGLVAIPEYFDLPEEYWRKGVSTGATIKTLDERYVMVELSGKSMNQNREDLVGGIMETDIPLCSGEDVFKSFYVELKEEIGVEERDIKECFLKAVLIERKTNVGLYFEVLLKLTAEELKKRSKDNQDPDIETVRFYTRAEYLDVLKKHNVNKQLIAETLLQI